MLSEDDGCHALQRRKIDRTLHANTFKSQPLNIHMLWTRLEPCFSLQVSPGMLRLHGRASDLMAPLFQDNCFTPLKFAKTFLELDAGVHFLCTIAPYLGNEMKSTLSNVHHLCHQRGTIVFSACVVNQVPCSMNSKTQMKSIQTVTENSCQNGIAYAHQWHMNPMTK